MTTFDALHGVVNACQALPCVVTGGQPAFHHLEAFRRAGGEVILDLRAPGEPRGFDEAVAAAELGLEYELVPVGPTPLTDELMQRILDVLRRQAGRMMLFHCASGNRVGGALLPHLILDHDMDEEDAIVIATRVGLRGQELLAWGLDYARRHGATP